MTINAVQGLSLALHPESRPKGLPYTSTFSPGAED
jgi:hypothetical protein